MGAGEVGEAEVAADQGDELGNRQVVDVVVAVDGLQALVELGLEHLGVGAVGVALDGVLDLADDLLARDAAALGGLRDGGGRGQAVAELAGEGDGAAQGAGDAVEGDGGVGRGCRGGRCAGPGVAWRWRVRARSVPISISSWRTWR